MIVYARRFALLLAAGLIASCGGSSNEDLDVNKSAHVLVPCNGKTPGFWCGGASTATAQDCLDVGFSSCTAMCTCLLGASAAKGVDDPDCPADCDDGMADVLQKFFAAFQLSFGLDAGFYCPGVNCGPENVCYEHDVDNMLNPVGGCSRSQMETAKDCIDAILNDGGQCSFPPVIISAE